MNESLSSCPDCGGRDHLAIALSGQACQIRVWLDGIYPTKCGRLIVRGECLTHGKVPPENADPEVKP